MCSVGNSWSSVILNVVASIVGPIVMFALLPAVLPGPHDWTGRSWLGLGGVSLIMSPLLSS